MANSNIINLNLVGDELYVVLFFDILHKITRIIFLNIDVFNIIYSSVYVWSLQMNYFQNRYRGRMGHIL